MDRPQRELVAQAFINYTLAVGTTPTPLNNAAQQANIQSRYDSFIISVPNAAANAVYLGGPNISAGPPPNGLEIRPGIPIQLSISNERQLYELQSPLMDMVCKPGDAIPFIVWDLSNIFLIATAGTNIGVLLFKAMFI